MPTFAEIEKHIKDIIASGEAFDTLSPEWKIDIKGGNRVVDKITNQGNFQKLKNPQKKRHNKYVAGIKELINNSQYSHSADNDKPKEKPNVEKYHYFDVNVKIGDKTYWVRLECEENKNVPSGIYGKRSQTPFGTNTPKGRYANRSKNSSRSDNNLEQTNNDVKTVHLYNIKEMKANKNIQPKFQKIDDDFDERMNRIRYGKITDVNDSGAKFDDKLWLSPEQIENQGYDFSKFENRIGEVVTLDFNRPMVRDLKFEKLSKERPQEKPTFNNKPVDLNIESVAKKHFGTTSNFKVAGYILNDGSMLDFSGQKFGGNANIRSIDHREITDAFIENEKYEDIGFNEFIDNGAIRYMPESNSILIARMPSEKQFKKLKDVIIQANGEISIEMVQGMDNWGNSQKSFQKDYEKFSNPDKILADVRTYFNGGKISPLKTYFQSDDMNSNINNARGFTYQRKNFDGTEKENLIVLLNKKADKSTLMHEFAHVYLITLNNLAQHNDKAKELLMDVYKFNFF